MKRRIDVGREIAVGAVVPREPDVVGIAYFSFLPFAISNSTESINCAQEQRPLPLPLQQMQTSCHPNPHTRPRSMAGKNQQP